jgi:dolichyl-phosphate-mannose-protein mannosyltransferase
VTGAAAERGAGNLRWTRLDTLAVVVMTTLGAFLRGFRLTTPHRLYFDEPYYAKAACVFVEPLHRCGVNVTTRQDLVPEHPPLAKWLIAGGIRLFGFTPLGWRIAPLLFGIAAIPIVYLLAWRTIGSTAGATVSSGLVAIDFLEIVQSRVAMLDVFASTFGLLAFLFLALDREAILGSPRGKPHGRGLFRRRWRLACGAASGAAAACKWEGWFVLAAAMCLALLWEGSAARRDSRGNLTRRVAAAQGPSLVVAFLIVPVAIYTLTFVGTVHGSLLIMPWQHGAWVRALLHRQRVMLTYHISLSRTHPYISPPWSWLLLKRPVAYFFQSSTGHYQEVLGTGSPLVWWASVPALGIVAWRWLRAHDALAAEGMIVTGFVFCYAPWLLLSERRVTFLYYILPAVPFMCMAVGYVVMDVRPSIAGRGAVAGLAATSLLVCAFYYPVLTAASLSYNGWHSRMLFRDCGSVLAPSHGRAGHKGHQLPAYGTVRPPPSGWCWI